MSGHKRATVSISQDEYDRLREAELKLRALPQVPPPVVAQASQRSIDFLESYINNLQSRQASLENTLSGMHDYIRDLEASTSQAILDYEAQAVSEAQNYAGCLWDHFDQVLDEHTRYFNETIQANHQQQQNELTQFSRRLRKMTTDMEEKQQLAEEWLQAAQAYADFIKANYFCDSFFPGRLEKLERQVNQAAGNLQDGLSEAVIVASQQLYCAFSDFRVELEQAQNEWQLLIQTAWEAVNQLLAQAEQSRVVQAIDFDGNFLPFPVDVDYWCTGRLTVFEEELNYVKSLLESSQDLPNTETLEHWLRYDLPIYEKSLGDILLDARVNALNSQLRINIADLVIRALQEQGFAETDYHYDAEDQRNSYGVKMQNLAGNEVLVQVDPVGQAVGENELHLQSLDREERTEHELQQRWQEISRSLAAYGLRVGQYVREDAPAYQAENSAPRARSLKQSQTRKAQQSGAGPGYGD